MRWLLVRLIISAVVMAIVTSGLLPGIRIVGNFAPTWVAVSVIFAVVNVTIKPVLRFLTCPLIIVTLGLIGILINVGMLYLTALGSRLLFESGRINGQFIIDTFLNAVIAALIVTVATMILERLFDSKEHEVRVKKVTEVRYVVEKQRPDLDAQFNQMISQNAPQQQYPPQAAPPPQYPSQAAPPPQYPTQNAPQYPPQAAPQYPPQAAPQYPPQAAPQYPPPQQAAPPPIPPQYPPGTFGTQPPAPPRKSGTPDDWDFDDPAFPRKK